MASKTDTYRICMPFSGIFGGSDAVPPRIGAACARHLETSGTEEVHMADLVDIAIPAGAQATAEALGLKVQRSVLSGARVRQIPRDEAELAIAYLREWGFSARILEHTPEDGPNEARAA
jgi:hypothetical protein